MADVGNDLVKELKKQAELTKRATKAQENLGKSSDLLKGVIEQNNRLVQYNLRASELLAIDLGGTTTVFEKYFGASRSLESAITDNEAITRTLGQRIGTLSDSIIPALGDMVDSVDGFVEGYSTVDKSIEYNAKVIDKVSSTLVKVSRDFFASGKSQAKATDALIPEVVANSSRMALFSAGLERNSTGIGRFVARSKLLGEDIESMTLGIRSLTNKLTLSTREQNNLVIATANFAKTYKSSTESVLSAMGRLADIMSVANRSNNRQTTALFAQIQAMTDRIAPDALQTALTPLFAQGAESLAKATMLGVVSQARRLTAGTATIDDVRDIMRASSSFRARVVSGDSGYEASVIGEEIVKSLIGLDSAQINMLEIAEQSINEQQGLKQETATINDGLRSANAFLFFMEDSLEKLKMAGLEYLQKLVETIGPEILKKIAVIATVVGVITTIAIVIGTIIAIIMTLPGSIGIAISAGIAALTASLMTFFDDFWTDAKKWFRSTFDGLPDAVLDFVLGSTKEEDEAAEEEKRKKEELEKRWRSKPDLPQELDTKAQNSLEGIQENTETSADEVRRRENQRLLEASQRYDTLHTQILKDLINASERQGLREQMEAKNAVIESKKLNSLVSKLIDEMVNQNNLLRDQGRKSLE